MEMKGDVRNSRGPHRSGVGVGSRGGGAQQLIWRAAMVQPAAALAVLGQVI